MFDEIVRTIEKFNVDFLVGDFNMSNFVVIEELANRGCHATLCAW